MFTHFADTFIPISYTYIYVFLYTFNTNYYFNYYIPFFWQKEQFCQKNGKPESYLTLS